MQALQSVLNVCCYSKLFFHLLKLYKIAVTINIINHGPFVPPLTSPCKILNHKKSKTPVMNALKCVAIDLPTDRKCLGENLVLHLFFYEIR
jgi:hypothetical protein